jgi:hypothetical protein
LSHRNTSTDYFAIKETRHPDHTPHNCRLRTRIDPNLGKSRHPPGACWPRFTKERPVRVVTRPIGCSAIISCNSWITDTHYPRMVVENAARTWGRTSSVCVCVCVHARVWVRVRVWQHGSDGTACKHATRSVAEWGNRQPTSRSPVFIHSGRDLTDGGPEAGIGFVSLGFMFVRIGCRGPRRFFFVRLFAKIGGQGPAVKISNLDSGRVLSW